MIKIKWPFLKKTENKPIQEISAPTFAESAAPPVIQTDTSDKVEKAVQWAISIANDNSHGYSQANRTGPDYDCSSLVIAAFEWAGIPVGNATYTGNMYSEFTSNGWKDVTSEINLSTGAGLIRGDVLLNDANHTCLYIGDGKVVNARTDSDGRQGDSYGDEIRIQSYWNFNPWNHVLRWPADGKIRPKPLDVDGEFGRLTEEAVRNFQKDIGFIPSGSLDEGTWISLLGAIKYEHLQNGSLGDRVKLLQLLLNIYQEGT